MFRLSFAALLLIAATANAEVRTTANSPDLAATGLGFSPSGLVTFTLRNNGAVGVSGPFRISVFLKGTLRQSVEVGAVAGTTPAGRLGSPLGLLGAREERTIVASDARVEKCAAASEIKIILDPTN